MQTVLTNVVGKGDWLPGNALSTKRSNTAGSWDS